MARYRKCCGNIFQRWWRRLFVKPKTYDDIRHEMIRNAVERLKDRIDKEILLNLEGQSQFFNGGNRDEQKPYRHNSSA